MRTCAAGCLSTPLTSQMVGWTWTCSESESSSLLRHTGVPLAAPRLSVTFCLRYICAASVSHPGQLKCLSQMSHCSHMSPYGQYCRNFPSHQTRTLSYRCFIAISADCWFYWLVKSSLYRENHEEGFTHQSNKCVLLDRKHQKIKNAF